MIGTVTRLLFSFALISSFCPAQGLASAQAPLPVAVSIVPQKYFVEKIGGGNVDVEVMVPAGATPEQYEPKPKQMTALGRSRIYFAIGVPFETIWLSRISAANPNMLIVHTEQDIEKREMEAHSHGHEPGESRGGHATTDPHVWLSPTLVVFQARSIFTALAANDPQNRQVYEANYKTFISELVDLDLSIARRFPAGGGFMVFHPAWGYFADAYGLQQFPVEVEGKEPKARELDQLIEVAKTRNIKTIFVQPQYSPRSAQALADAIGGKLVPADDLAPDWADNLRRVAEQIAAATGGRK